MLYNNEFKTVLGFEPKIIVNFHIILLYWADRPKIAVWIILIIIYLHSFKHKSLTIQIGLILIIIVRYRIDKRVF